VFEFLCGALGIICIVIAYLAELIYYILGHGGFPL
jgi:hypothetical protein